MTSSHRLVTASLALAFVLAWSVGGRGQQPAPVQLPEAAKGTGIIIGQVVDAAGDRPIADAIVSMNVRPAAPLPGARGVMPARGDAGQGGAPAPRGAGPAPGARGGPLPQQRVMTGADGRFVFYDLPAGTYTISAQMPGYTNGLIGQTRAGGGGRPLQLDDGGRVTDAKIRLWRQGAVSGIVIDETGEPAVRSNVRAMRRVMSGGLPRYQQSGVTITDDRGMYRIPNLAAGEYLIAVPSTQATMPAAVVDAMFQGIASGTGVGTAFLDAASSGIAPVMTGVRVGDFLFSTGGTMGTLSSPAPASDGRLAVYQTMYHPSSTSVGQATVVTIGSGDERSGVNVQLKLVPAVTVTGMVTGPDGPMPNVGIRLAPAGGDGADTNQDVATTISAPDGTFTFLGVPPGQYFARAQKMPRPPIPAEMAGNPLLQMAFGPGGPPASAQTSPLFGRTTATVGDTDVSGLALRMSEGARISGRVVFEGTAPAPAPEAIATIQVTATPVDGGTNPTVQPGARGAPNAPRPGLVDQNGQFRTQGYPAGRYFVAPAFAGGGRGGGPPWTLKSAMAGGRDISTEALEIEDADVTDVVITFTDRVGSVAGAVREPTGTPAKDGFVFLFPADYRNWIRNGMSVRRTAVGTISPTGAYQLPRLLGGEYLVVAPLEAEMTDRENPAFIDAAARVATRVTVADGQTQPLDLTVVRVVR